MPLQNEVHYCTNVNPEALLRPQNHGAQLMRESTVFWNEAFDFDGGLSVV